ncbi:MAG: arginine N-succinyltransferase [Deltaproteobacteria bacterium]|nr:MAG: arginine N-succinyltransferase [Deltaproteobacteria bacterium]
MALLLRDIRPEDLGGLLALAEQFDTVNLPADRAVLAELIDRSARSFAGPEDTPGDGLYLFALVDDADGTVLGSSMIIASHGTPEDPHNFFRIDADERFSPTLGKVFRHETLTFRQSYTPHTELGGLMLDPSWRGHPQRLGRLLSLVRFLYIALHPRRFHDRLQAELLPPFEADGSSRLWEWLGRRFTGLDYPEADRLSRANREFIPALFPRVPIYTALLPPEVRAVIGAVHPDTLGVERLLTSLGFVWNRHIDPFDGGPHYEARQAEVPLLGSVVRCGSVLEAPAGVSTGPCLVHMPRAPGRFEATVREAVVARDELLVVPRAAAGSAPAEWRGVEDEAAPLDAMPLPP